jgi:hypothetical protein
LFLKKTSEDLKIPVFFFLKNLIVPELKSLKIRAAEKFFLLLKTTLGYQKVFLLPKLNFGNKKNKKLNKSYLNVKWQKAIF